MATTPLEISLAGYPLLLEDPAGKVQQWLDQYLPIDDLRAVTSWQRTSWSTWNTPSPNYSTPLRTKINTWYRPTGAARWAFGLFLADTRTKNAILAAQGTTVPGVTLRLGYGNVSRSWLAFCLPPRPLGSDVSELAGLWLIPVVDERYYWQFVGGGGTVITDTTTWAAFFASLASALDITLRLDSVSANYGTPHVTSFVSGAWSNAAVMLDAAALSVGQRVVLDYEATGAGDGSYFADVYRSCSWSTSRTKRTYNLNLPTYGQQQKGVIPGSDLGLAAITPASVKVIFNSWDGGILIPTEHYVSTQAAGTYVSTGSTSGRTLAIQSTALADFTGAPGSPANQTTLDNLAAQIASDFYQGLGWISDQSIMGIPGYIETGFDDYVEFSVGRRRSDGGYELRCRVHTAPYNFGVQSMLHQVADTHEYADFVEGKLDGAMTAGGSATLSVWEAGADTGRNVTVYDKCQWNVPAGAWVEAVPKVEDRQWRPVAASCYAV